jgi:hypothetical protein
MHRGHISHIHIPHLHIPHLHNPHLHITHIQITHIHITHIHITHMHIIAHLHITHVHIAHVHIIAHMTHACRVCHHAIPMEAVHHGQLVGIERVVVAYSGKKSLLRYRLTTHRVLFEYSLNIV